MGESRTVSWHKYTATKTSTFSGFGSISAPVKYDIDPPTIGSEKNFYPEIAFFVEKIFFLENGIEALKENHSTVVKLNILLTKRIRTPLDVIVESDGEGFIARSVDLPLFGYGDDRLEAIEALKFEIESLYDDLLEDDDFTDEWKAVKHFLKEQIIDL